jgi:hypothetical protein
MPFFRAARSCVRIGKKRNHFVEPGATGLAPIAGTLNFYRKMVRNSEFFANFT